MSSMVRDWFGDADLKADDPRPSTDLKLPHFDLRNERIILKLSGTDLRGNHVSTILDALKPR